MVVRALRLQLRMFGLALIVLGLGWLVYDRVLDSGPRRRAAWGRWVDPNAPPEPPAPVPPARGDAPARDADSPSASVADPDFPRKGPPRPGEWLFRFHEPGQTVDDFKKTCNNLKRGGRDTITIQPLGDLLKNHKDVIEQVREYVAIYYDCEVEIAEPLAMPKAALVERRRQYDADKVIAALRPTRPDKALCYVGFCEEDLFAEDLNFVFGVGDPARRTGVYSLARYGDKADRVADEPFDPSRPGSGLAQGEPIFLKRTLKVATHEIGHMFGMLHCIRYECNMNGSNSLAETDREPMHFCPECLAKAVWCTSLDPKARYGKLAAWYDTAGLKADAAFARRQAGR